MHSQLMTQEFADLFLRTNDSQWEKAQSYVQLHHPMIWFSSSTELKMRIGHRREFVSRSFDWAVFKAYRSCNTPNWWCTTIFLDFFSSFSRANTFKPLFQVRSGIHWKGSEKRKVCGRSSCCYTEKKQTAFPKMGDGILQAIDESVRCTSRENVLDKSRVITRFMIELIYNRDCNDYNDL